VVITEYEDGQGVYRNTDKRIILKVRSGTERDLLDVLINVINYWQDELFAMGLIPKRAKYQMPDEPEPRPRAECNGGRIDFEMIQGVRFKATFWLKKFNYQTGAIEPVDHSGAEMAFRVFKPLYNVDVCFTNDTTKEKLVRTLLLDEQESQDLLKCQTEQELAQFLGRLPKALQAIHELKQEIRHREAGSAAEDDNRKVEGTGKTGRHDSQHFWRGSWPGGFNRCLCQNRRRTVEK
jgi:hypothetical protein